LRSNGDEALVEDPDPVMCRVRLGYSLPAVSDYEGDESTNASHRSEHELRKADRVFELERSAVRQPGITDRPQYAKPQSDQATDGYQTSCDQRVGEPPKASIRIAQGGQPFFAGTFRVDTPHGLRIRAGRF
jgi:hypothetical protein